MNIKLLAVAFFCLTFNIVNLNAQDWKWAKTSGGVNSDNFNANVTDANGNTFVAGFFYSSSLVFPTSPTSTTLTNPGGSSSSDVMIVKYDASGNVAWAKSMGGSGDDQANGISLDANGNIYVIGNFKSASVTFGSTTLSNVGTNTSDIFVAKFDASGNVLWAKSAGSTGNDLGNAICTDASGNSYITGAFNGASITFGTTTLNQVGLNDFYVAKYDASGTVSWAAHSGGIYQEIGKNITIDGNGDIYAAGSFSSPSISFGSTAALSNNVSGANDVFLVKYNSSGTALWSVKAGGTDEDECNGICIDGNNNCYISGHYNGSSMIFGGTVSDISNGGGASTRDFFIAKYNSSGVAQWAKSFGGGANEFARNLISAADGNIYAAGNFLSTAITFGTTTLANAAAPSTSYSDVFITKFDPSGNVLWAQSVGGNLNDEATGLGVDANGYGYLSGSFTSGTLTFGATSLTGAGVNNNFNTYIAKFDLDNLVSSINSDRLEENSVNIYPNPFGESTTISFNKDLQNATAIIVNTYGKEVKRMNFKGDQLAIEKENLQPGIYFVQVMMDEELMITEKMIVE